MSWEEPTGSYREPTHHPPRAATARQCCQAKASVTEKCGKLDADVAIITKWGAEVGGVGEDWWGADAMLVENVSRL